MEQPYRMRCPHCRIGIQGLFEHWKLGLVCPVCLKPFWHEDLVPKKRNGGQRGKLVKVAKRDRWRCHLCGGMVEKRAKGVEAPTLDHLIPRSLGGSNAMNNLKLAHAGCNQKRGNTLLEAEAPYLQTAH